MGVRSRRLVAGLVLGVLAAFPGVAAERDPETGLVIAEHWELVKTQCTVCHSAKLITAQRADRGTWLDIIRWMQATQNLWAFDPQTESRILDYLASHYGPGESARRKPLSRFLMPENPYKPALE